MCSIPTDPEAEKRADFQPITYSQAFSYQPDNKQAQGRVSKNILRLRELVTIISKQ